VYLGPARDAGLDPVPLAVTVDTLFEATDELGTLRSRADDAHLALEHVDKLRELVEVGVAQEPADRRPPIGALDAAGAEALGEDESGLLVVG
jgi:hypothetical protein